jgi:phosphatidylglycerophosphate synthase
MPIFTPEEVEHARKYKYSGKDDSIFGRLVMQHYWVGIMRFCPMWIAPNMITVLGLIVELISFTVAYRASEAFTQPISNGLCVFNGVCFFIYSTLDAMDGKQARRTGSSSPLGQFFDHGCDAITTVCEMMKLSATFDLRLGFPSFIIVYQTCVGFILTSYEEYVTHTFYLGPINAPTEGVLSVCLVQVVVGLFPALRPLIANRYVLVAALISGCAMMGQCVYDVTKASLLDAEKRHRAIVGILPTLTSIAISVGLVVREPELMTNPWFIMAAGLILSYQAQICVIGHLLFRRPWSLFNLPVIFCLAAEGASVVVRAVPGFASYWHFYCAVLAAVVFAWDVYVIMGFSRGLGIPVFTLPKKHAA